MKNLNFGKSGNFASSTIIGREFKDLNEIFIAVGGEELVNVDRTMTNWERKDGQDGLLYKEQYRNLHLKDGRVFKIDETGWNGNRKTGLVVLEEV